MILVTGATGFIGTNLVRRLVATGEPVRILRRAGSSTPGLVGLPIEHHVGDLLDEASVRAATSGCDRVYHLAAAMDLTRSSDKRVRVLNVEGTRTVARACEEEGVERLVYASSGMTIGHGRKGRAATESAGVRFEPGIPYVDSKVAAERVIQERADMGLPAVIVNPGYVFGPWDRAPKLNRFLIMSAKGQLQFYFTGGLSIVSVHDVVTGLIGAMERGRVGERYIVSHLNLSYQRFFAELNRYNGRTPPSIRIPKSAWRAVGSLSETLSRLPRVALPMSRDLARLQGVEHYLSSKKARGELGYQTTELRRSLDITYGWLRASGWLKAGSHRGSAPPRDIETGAA